MTFDHYETYRRKPITVHALRLTAEGNIPIWFFDAQWVRRLLAEGRLRQNRDEKGPASFWINPSALHVRVAYPGDWIVLIDGEDRLTACTDEEFRRFYEEHELETEDA